MADRYYGLEILAGIQEIKAHKEEKVVLVTRVLREPSRPPKKPDVLNPSNLTSTGLLDVR